MSIKNMIQRIALTTITGLIGHNAFSVEGPPELPMYDQVGVNLSSGYATIMLEDLSIGSGVSALNHSIANHENFFWGFKDEFSGQVKTVTVPGNASHILREVQLGHSSQTFRLSGAALSPLNKDGSKLVNNGNGIYTYTTRDGTIALIHGSKGPLKITKPNGHEYTIHRKGRRIQSVTTNTGLQFKYSYLDQSPPGRNHGSGFNHPIRITAINNAVEYCSPTADSCSLTNDWPTVNYQWPAFNQLFGTSGQPSTHKRGIFKVTDAGGQETRYTHRPYSIGLYGQHFYEPRIIEIKSETSSGTATSTFDYTHYQTCVRNAGGWDCRVLNSNVVYKANIANTEWTYNYPKANTPYVVGTNYSYGPNGTAWVTIDRLGTLGGPLKFFSASGHTVTHKQDDTRHVTRVDYPEGYHATFTYDSRGNLKQRVDHGDSTITSSANYESGCDNQKICNQPRWIEDARGNITNFEYDSASGQITKKTLPAVNGIRPETRYFYANRYAYYKNSSGNYVRASKAVRMLVKESHCKNGAASGNGCASTGDEVVTEYLYGPANSGPNNLWLRGVAITADGQTRRTCYQYDNVGNKIAETQPNANPASCH